MKKQVLSALALCTCLGVAQAQTDVTGEYLVNPSFEENVSYKADAQATNIATGDQIQNDYANNGWKRISDIQGYGISTTMAYGTAVTLDSKSIPATAPEENGTAGLVMMASWGGAITYQQDAKSELPAGYYKLLCNVYNAGNGDVLQASNFGFVTDSKSYLSPKSSFTKATWSTEEITFYLPEQTSGKIQIGITTRNVGAKEQPLLIYDNVKLYKYDNPTSENPVDLSSYVGTSQTAWSGATGATTVGGISMVERYSNNYFTGNVFSQTVTGLPEGIYRVELYANASAAIHNDGGDVWERKMIVEPGDNTCTFVSVNGEKTGLPIDERTSVSTPDVLTFNAIEVTADGTLTISVDNDKEGANWIFAQIKSLLYQGNDASAALKTDVTELINEAKTYVEDSPGAVKDMLESAITEGETAINGSNTDALNAAINTLTDIIAKAKAIIPIATAMEAELSNAQIFMDVNTDYAKLLETGTDPDEFTAASQKLYAEEYQNMTQLNDMTTSTIGDISEWGGDMVMNKSEHWSGNEETQYVEQTSEQWKAGNWNVYKETSVTLPAGKYVLTATGRASAQATLTMSVAGKTVTFPQKGNGGYGVETDGIANLTADGTYADNGKGRGWEYRYCAFELDAEQEVTIRIDGSAVEEQQWVSISDVALYSVETEVSLNITGAGWATLILPFEAEVPENVTAYTCGAVGEVQDGVATLTLAETDKLEANTPYILQGAAGPYSFKGLSVATEDSYTVGLLTGTLVDMLAKEGTYVLQNQDSGVGFYKVGSDSQSTQPEIGAYRAYLNADAVAGGNVQAFILKSIDGDGTTTGIDSTVAEEDATVNVYNLNGILVRQNVKMSEALDGLQKGVYIVNGTKKAVK